MALGPFPFLLFPVYAYQWVKSPLAKFIFIGQVCVWEKVRMQINRSKTPNLHFIRQIFETFNYKNVVFQRREKELAKQVSLRNLRQKGCGKSHLCRILTALRIRPGRCPLASLSVHSERRLFTGLARAARIA